MRRHWRPVVLVLAGVLVYVGYLLFSGPSQVAQEALQYQLKAIGQSIYEYHTLTGQWPTHIDDLEKTTLGARLRYWKPILENGSIVVVWHDHLNDNPADNRDVVLAYHNKGTLAMMGRQWVCWGDLRTEYVDTKTLKAALNASK
jgi:hypothetical protein